MGNFVLANRWYGCYYRSRKDLFTAESNRHPAKMAVGLCFRIFEHGERMGYWKKGELILDPMAGIGTTLICGAVLGYCTVGVELEEHFVKLAWQNVEYLARKGLNAAARISLAQGDARRLTEILKTDGVISSPPYAGEPRQGTDLHPQRQEGGDWSGKYSGAVSSPPYGEMQVMEGDQAAHPGFKNCHLDERTDRGKVRETPGAIGYSGAISSPPYGDAAMPVAVRAEIRALARAGKWEEAIAELRKVDDQMVIASRGTQMNTCGRCWSRRSSANKEITGPGPPL